MMLKVNSLCLYSLIQLHELDLSIYGVLLTHLKATMKMKVREVTDPVSSLYLSGKGKFNYSTIT